MGAHFLWEVTRQDPSRPATRVEAGGAAQIFAITVGSAT